MRMYMNKAKHIPRMLGQRKLLENTISTGLQRQVAQYSNNSEDLWRPVYWTHGLDEEIVQELTRALRQSFYGPKEVS